MEHIAWLEQHSTDSEAAQKFYGTVLGLPTVPTDMGDHSDYSVMLGDRPAFGLIQSFEGMNNYVGWVPYIYVEDYEGACSRAAELGAETLYSSDSEQWGSYCIVKDPQGAIFGLFKKVSA
ncbi:MAG: hypothetical protein JST40_04170 [Armatimonadetes bacterium]|nr:hypothetical protein [Armatimonadota bacterium]